MELDPFPPRCASLQREENQVIDALVRNKPATISLQEFDRLFHLLGFYKRQQLLNVWHFLHGVTFITLGSRRQAGRTLATL
jgi:hypothetical protein